MTAARRFRLLPVATVVLALAACGGSAMSHTGRTVTFSTAGAFPTATIVGTYSAAGCAHDSRVIVDNADLFYEHSTKLPGPADLYFYDMRFAYAHFEADGCTSDQLGTVVRSRLTAARRIWLLRNLPGDFRRIFSAALAAAPG